MNLLVLLLTLILALVVTALLAFLIFAAISFCEDRLRGPGGAVDARYRTPIALAAIGLVSLALAVGMVLGRYSAGSSAGAAIVQQTSDAISTSAPTTTRPPSTTPKKTAPPATRLRPGGTGPAAVPSGTGNDTAALASTR